MPNDLKSIKEYLRKEGALHLGIHFKLTDKNPTEFVENFFCKYNRTYNTYEAGDNYVHTPSNAYRSASDVFRITYNYFPRVKLITIYRVIFKMLKEGRLCGTICSTVHKRVYSYCHYPKAGTTVFFDAKTDETGLDFKSIPEFAGVPTDTSNADSYIDYFNIPKL